MQQNNRPNLPTKNNMKRYNYSLLVLSLLINSTYAQDMSTTASSKSDSIKQLADVTITAQLAIPRRTPVAASNVSASQIEERLGNGEFVEALSYTPGVHPNRQGGGWGDSEIFMRGFDNANVAVMINGIPVNDMEYGTVYWSNWAGLSEVTSSIQVQRGIGATKLSAPSVGGTINIITRGFEAKKGGNVSYSLGNDNYQRTSFSYNSGQLANGWAFNILGSFSNGNGYAQGTDFSVYNYFANISRYIGENHLLSLTLFGAPQQHHSRSNALTSAEWDKAKALYAVGKDWRRYNPDYGFDSSGQRKTADYNEYHQPFLILKHLWQIDSKSNLSSTAYASIGSGGGYSGQAYGDTYTEYDWYGSDYGHLNMTFRKNDGTFDYAKIEQINASSADGSQMAMSQIKGKQKWFGLISTYSNQLLGCIDWFAGVDVRYYKNTHANAIVDLYGGDYFIDPNNGNKIGVGDIVYRDYDSNILQNGVFAQAEIKKGDINAFVSGSINLTDYWRYDRLYLTDGKARSKTIGFWCGNIKAGINYNINSYHNLFLNAGYNSKAPQFKSGVFMSANSSNIINDKIVNEKSASVELGYNLKHDRFNLMVNSYYTRWMDRTMTKKGKIVEQYYINMAGVNSNHMGIELESKALPADWIELGAMLSIGNWKFDDAKVSGYAYNVKGQAITSDGNITTPGAPDHAYATINMNDIHIGGSAQTTWAIDAILKPMSDLRLGAGYSHYSNNYAYYSLSGSSLKLGSELYVQEPWKVPSYGKLDMWASYKFNVSGSINATISGQVSNLLNEHYIEKAWNPTTVSKTEAAVNEDDVYYFYAAGRTWTIKLKFEF